jgi:hypothetical protein
MRRPAKASARSCRYTVEQVFRGMQAFVTDHCGADVVLELDKPITEYEQSARDSHECPLEFLAHMASEFGLSWGEARWMIWLKLRDKTARTKRQRSQAWIRWQREVGPTITVRDLAAYIARHSAGQSLAPATVFGVTCAKAGVFLGMCRMPEVAGEHVAPSTPLMSLRSSTRVRNLFRRLAWVSGSPLPALPGPDESAPWVLAFLAVPLIAVISVAAAFVSSPIVCGMAGMIACTATLWCGWRVADRTHDPLPAGVQTFGDLARLVVERQAAITAPLTT